MAELITLFLNNLLPIFLAAGAGFWLGKRLKVNPRVLSQVVFYIFSPCLVFDLITSSQLSDGDILRTFAHAGLTMGIVGLSAWGVGRLLRLDGRLLAAVVITSMFMNAGNFGLPLVDFAFGETSLAYASLFFVTSAIMVNTVGVLIASSGAAGIRQALIGLLKIPSVYGVTLALIFLNRQWQLPLPLDRTVELLGRASVPAMLVLLGLQLQASKWSVKLRALAVPVVARLVLSPLVALALTGLFDLRGAAFQAVVIEAGMPSAVLNTVLATEFGVEPSFVTSVVFICTLLSPLTLTPLLSFLGA